MVDAVAQLATDPCHIVVFSDWRNAGLAVCVCVRLKVSVFMDCVGSTHHLHGWASGWVWFDEQLAGGLSKTPNLRLHSLEGKKKEEGMVTKMEKGVIIELLCLRISESKKQIVWCNNKASVKGHKMIISSFILGLGNLEEHFYHLVIARGCDITHVRIHLQ